MSLSTQYNFYNSKNVSLNIIMKANNNLPIIYYQVN
jgi:hypothetical protein